MPPIDGGMAGVSVDAPTVGAVDDTGHRHALISRFSGAATINAVAPTRSFARLVEVSGTFPDAVSAGPGRSFFVELSPLPSQAEAAGVFRVLGERGAIMPTFYVSGPN